MFSINVTTLRRVLSAAIPGMTGVGRGSVVNVGAMGALKAGGNMGAYAAAKSTVMRLTESLSDEVKHKGINVNAVLPTLIDTPRNRADMPGSDFSNGLIQLIWQTWFVFCLLPISCHSWGAGTRDGLTLKRFDFIKRK